VPPVLGVQGPDAAALDATVALAADAAVSPADVGAPATLIVESDLWCDVFVDDAKVGKRSEPIAVRAGRHVVRCDQGSTGNAWSQAVELSPGETRRVRGQLLGAIDVTFDIDASLDGVAHRRGEVAHVKSGQHQVGEKWRSLRASCTVRDRPELDCY
jgi:hypothetical protein